MEGTTKYVYGLDLISATDGSGTTTYFTTDGLGSTTDLTNSSGTATDQYTYDVFGALSSHTGTSSNPWLFTGEQTDTGGLQYLRARYYDQATGRFMSRDPIPSNNAYTYAFSNPTYFVDPYGLWPSVPNPVTAVKSAANAVADVGTAVYKNADDVARAVGPYAGQCAIWGVGGFIAGVQGAAVGCVAGAGALLAQNLFGRNPLSDCVAWGWAGFKLGGGYWGAGIGCATALGSYVLPKTDDVQCGIWLAGAFAQAKNLGATGLTAIRGGLGGCFGGAFSTHRAGVAYSDSPYPHHSLGDWSGSGWGPGKE
jgi:RHS repeat-associated protein